MGARDIRNCYLINVSEEISAAVKLNIQTQIKYISDTFHYQIFNRHGKLAARSTYVFWEYICEFEAGERWEIVLGANNLQDKLVGQANISHITA